MKNKQLLKFVKPIGLTFSLVLVLLVGCSKEDETVLPEDPSPAEFNRTELLTNYADKYIKPAYAAYYNEVNSLKSEVSSFNNSPTIGALQNLRTKWENTLLVWQDVAFLEFGPAASISLRAQTNVYPVDITLINNNISSGSYNLEAASNFDAKGLQTMDYLLNGITNNDADIVTYFVNNANAKTLLQDVINDLETNTNNVNTSWQNSYSGTFIANSASNAQGSSVSNIINALNQHYETYIRKGKVGLPAGVFNGFSGVPLPEHVEAYYSNKSLPYVYRSLTSLQKFINGNAYANSSVGSGLDDYMVFVNAQNNGEALHTVINNQFSSIEADLDKISDPLSNEVTTNTSGVKDVYEKMQQMVGYIKVDMTSALEVLITYQDSDGD